MAKRIGAIVSICLIALLVTATIVMANIDVSHNIKYKNPTEVWVSYNGGEQVQLKSETQIQEILSKMDDATEENFLTALFNKTLKEKPVLKQKSTTTSSIPSTSGYYVILSYENPQKLDGKDVYYTQLVFTVENTGEEVETKVYVSEDGTLNYRYYYVLNVNYTPVYDYLTNQGFNG